MSERHLSPQSSLTNTLAPRVSLQLRDELHTTQSELHGAGAAAAEAERRHAAGRAADTAALAEASAGAAAALAEVRTCSRQL
eukprot:SAG22_NODE_1064_length_5756_cov_48.259502_8_plen_82_part_00